MSLIKPEFSKLISKLKEYAHTHNNDTATIQAITPLVKELASSPSWVEDKYFHVDPDAGGFNGYKIHEETDHSLAVFVTSWLPRCGSPPHNHGTWAISASVIADETHTIWKRTDDGTKNNYAAIVEEKKIICKPGDVIVLHSEMIHSVLNDSDQVAITLQVYGKHPHFTNRIQINPITNETSSFIGKEAT